MIIVTSMMTSTAGNHQFHASLRRNSNAGVICLTLVRALQLSLIFDCLLRDPDGRPRTPNSDGNPRSTLSLLPSLNDRRSVLGVCCPSLLGTEGQH